MAYLHDLRHVDVLVKDLGLEHGNSVQTPAVHDKLQDVCSSVKTEQI